MKPSDIVILVPPLIATFGTCEAEVAAAYLVLACRHDGDYWQPIRVKRLAQLIERAFTEKLEPWHSLVTNPFLKPDLHLLVKKGGARWTEHPNVELEFTMWGLLALQGWQRYRVENVTLEPGESVGSPGEPATSIRTVGITIEKP